MAVTVPLRFVPPDVENLVLLRIYEGATPEGQFNLIDSITEIGEYPTYIDNYTTKNASTVSNWFAISWVDDKGAETELSAPLQGADTTLIGEIVSRVRERSPNSSLQVVTQEAEYVISEIMKTQDPYDTNLVATYRQKEGITLLTLARVEISNILVAQAASSDFTAGLVSMKSASGGASVSQDTIDYLLHEAAKVLGLKTSIVAQMAPFPIAGGFAVQRSLDQSRLLMEID